MINTARVAGLALLGASSFCFAAEAPLASGALILNATELDAVTAGASVISTASALADGTTVFTVTSARGNVGQGVNKVATQSNGAAIAIGLGGTASADADSQHIHANPAIGFQIKETVNMIGYSVSFESSYFVSEN